MSEAGAKGSLTRVESGAGRDAAGVVVWLHGLGADGNDFAPLWPELGLERELPLRYVMPNAPHQAVTINGGMRMPAWYDIRGFDLDGNRDLDEAGMEASAAAVEAVLHEEIAAGTPANRILLGGFSQGGLIALWLGLRFPERLAGIVGCSTYMVGFERLEEELSDSARETPFFLAHGTEDPVVPLALGERTAQELRDRSLDVRFETYPMPHSLHPQQLRDLADFFRLCFGPGAQKAS